MDISVVVPTLNRPDFLLRLVQYLAGQNFGGRILIGDSSDAETFARTARELETYCRRLDIQHTHLPGHSVTGVVRILNVGVTTRYACLVPDDDFVVPKAMANCIQFLDRSPSFVAAHGFGILVESSCDNGLIDAASAYPQPAIDCETARGRLERHLKNYTVSLFSVHRTEVWRRMFDGSSLSGIRSADHDTAFVDELLPCCLSVVYGKVGQLDELYLVRQGHPRRYFLAGWYSWLTSAHWQPNYTRFRTRLTEAVAEQDGIRLSQAELLVEQAFAQYLAQSIAPRPRRTRALLRGVPGAVATWQTLNWARDRFLPGRRLTLRSLLNKHSPHHAHFMPVFEALTRSHPQH